MVDVGDKAVANRRAVAERQLRCSIVTLVRLRERRTRMGEVIATAELAGVMGPKWTADLIPLCHPLPLTKVVVDVETDDRLPGPRVRAKAHTRGQTGVEMEALTALPVACLAVFDMLKAVHRDMVIEAVRVVSKSGGRSGDWRA